MATENGDGYDLICMDILLPEIDGETAVKEHVLWSESEGILSSAGAKIIMTTALDEMKDMIRSFQDLCDAYLVEPINVPDLLNTCRLVGLSETAQNLPKFAPNMIPSITGFNTKSGAMHTPFSD